jgi:hypothetical protein
MCTDPWVKDTDNDGLEDGEEVHTYFTDPCDDDSDDDGMLDGAEVAYDCSGATDPGAIANLDPNNPDSDGDNLSDGTDEGAIGTNPCDPDTDDDLVQDDVDACPLGGGVENGSFEAYTLSDGQYRNNGAPGWDKTGGQGGDWNPSAAQACADNFINGIPDGDQVAFSNRPEFSQDFGVFMSEGVTYELALWVGGRCGSLSGKNYTASLTSDGSSLTGGATTAGTNPDGDWTELTLSFTAGAAEAGTELGILLANDSDTGQVNWDHVTLEVDGNAQGCVVTP